MVKDDNSKLYNEKDDKVYNNLLELLDSIENERVLDDLSVKEIISKENEDFTEFERLIMDENSHLNFFSKFESIPKVDQNIKIYKNKNNIHNMMHSYKSLNENNKLSLELPYNIERADIKIEGNPKHIDFNDSLIEGNNKIVKDTIELKKSNLNNKNNDNPDEIVEKIIPEINKEIIPEIIQTVTKNPRITLWSIQSASVLRYLRKTRPEFSISKEASLLIDEAIREKYPEIWKFFEEIE